MARGTWYQVTIENGRVLVEGGKVVDTREGGGHAGWPVGGGSAGDIGRRFRRLRLMYAAVDGKIMTVFGSVNQYGY